MVWEYHITTGTEKLEALGQEEWELIAVVPMRDNQPVLYFKRPTPSFRQRVTEEQKRRLYASLGLLPKLEERS